ncbi:MAG TPA: DUF4082 domain-containing protein [Terriglobales bacterium]|nr:DUF4082 domain-containing protein [Terriglobales bacterium]
MTGTPATTWDISGSGDATIQGFATDISFNVGQTVSFKISTDATNYRLDIYRMGYYQGRGARLITSISPSVTLPQAQPACLTDSTVNLVDCGNWAVSATWTIPSGAVSGIYFAKVIRLDTGGASHIVFVVRNDSSSSDILFQTSDETWQAYNPYGGHSLYGGNTFDLTNRAYKVSYNRPFSTRSFQVQSWVFYAEYPMVRWLEANGYNVSYFTSIDADRNGNLIRNHRAFLSVGHDEYWSAQQRANVEAARTAGVSLGFFSGNEVFWKTRWENSIDGSGTAHRTLVCYKETLGPSSSPPATAATDPLDPPTWTGTWRDPSKSPPADGGRPENALTGQLFRANGPGTDNTNLFIQVPAAQGKLRFWRNTQVAAQSAGQTYNLPAGTLGYEWDVEPDNGFRPAGEFDLSTATYNLTTDYLLDFGGRYGAGTATHHASLYRSSSGALVFGAGTVQWSWGLDAAHDGGGSAADPNMQQATVNLFADMGVQPATLQAGLVLASKSVDSQAPASTVTSPKNGATLSFGSSVNVTGTATDIGGLVAGVEVSTDGGSTWHPATGTANWSYAWIPSSAGSITLQSRAVDDTGNLESPSSGVTVTVPEPSALTIFSPSAVPGILDVGPDQAVELGVKFTADVNGSIKGIRFYKSTSNTGTHIGNLWSSSGALLGSATFSGETASGWQQVNFATPVKITSGTVYVASYHTNVGHYSDNLDYFTNSGVDNPPLHALQDGLSGFNGLFAYASSSTFPNNGFRGSNYWVDVSFVPAAVLSSISVTPLNPSIQSGKTQQFKATGTYSDNSTQDISAEVIWSSSNTAVGTINNAGLATAIAGGSATITATQGAVSGSTTLTVQPTPIVISTTTLASGVQGQAYSAVLTASGGTAPYSWSLISNTVLPAGLSLSSGGQISGTPTVVGTSTFTVQVSDGGSPQQSANKQLSISITAPPTIYTIWSATALPGIVDAGADSAVELGVKFKADVNGTITGVRFYKSSANTGTHVGSLWSSSGTLLASATFSNETGSGWQQVDFVPPVSITAGTVYLASYHANSGHYSVDLNYFASVGVDNAPLHALQNGVSGFNGVFAYGSTSIFPSNGFNSSNYWVDVVFTPSAALNSIAITPLNPTITAGSTQQFKATGTYSDNSTQDITSQVSWSSSNTAVATINSAGLATAIAGGSATVKATQGTVSGSTTLTVQPTALAISTTSLSTGVQNQAYSATLAGSGGTAPYTWSLANNTVLPAGLSLSSGGQITGAPTLIGTSNFTVKLTDGGSPQQSATKQLSITVTAPPTFYSIWSASTVPGTVDAGPDSGVELGVKFKADVNGSISGIRFYKSSANTGTHIANLWSSSGTLLASATFSNETASGWQQVNFATPVSITAGMVYVASYHLNAGHYSMNQNYFTTAGSDNAPLHALQNGVSGFNGVFAYGTTSTFPSGGFNSSNYWVDVVFTTP